ncbi:hypothetical protein A3709_05815 [Halioglobus sp. HI00S01]|uniref:hypothetical protein n=1 Tax=Halioglobus sp. HI00S01 TaxID=1822214 RepID=UPI0007C2CA36|nr:hypothetical protein [Halioglobus sp. HI00S01]KZX56611.1 hypothetical protein A3709_05815 [Halioglobus sp. HI00S01]
MDLTRLPEISPPLPWHADAWTRLHQQLGDQRLPHALMLVGLDYSGADRLALALARLLLCHSPSGGLNCGTCHGCQLSASGTHGDFMWLAPEEGSRVIKIDQVRQAVDLAQQTANFGAHKVIIFEPAEAMNVAAANALLKSLEEPSAGTHLILVCSRPHGVPATIRSRCQMLKLASPTAEQSLAWLDQLTGDRQSSSDLLELADGKPLLAEAMCRNPDDKDQHVARLTCRSLFQGKVSAAEATGLLAGTSAPEMIEHLLAATQGFIRRLNGQALTSPVSREAFLLLDELGRLRMSVEGGANPNPQLLAEVMVGKVDQLLGLARADGTIGA